MQTSTLRSKLSVGIHQLMEKNAKQKIPKRKISEMERKDSEKPFSYQEGLKKGLAERR